MPKPGEHRAKTVVLAAIRRFAELHGLPARDSGVLLAVSGGADSMALLHAMCALAPQYGWRLCIAHLNHRLRTEAVRDAAFVGEAAAVAGVPVVTGGADVSAHAARSGLSIEMAARELRYTFLADTAAAQACTCIVTAHTAGDQAETVLMRMARGCGLTGLRGIPPVGETGGVTLLRPLLAVSRAQIEAYLAQAGQAWREDASNADPAYRRNRVRHNVLPVIAAELNPRAEAALCRLAALADEDEAVLSALAGERLPHCLMGAGDLSVPALLATVPAIRRRVLLRWLYDGGVPAESVTAERVEAALRLCGGAAGSRSLDVGGGFRLQRAYDRLCLTRGGGALVPAAYAVAVAVPGLTAVPGTGLTVHTVMAPGLRKDSGAELGDYPRFASLRLAPGQVLTVRSRRPGDRIAPSGMSGTRKVQDILVDARVPAAARDRIPVFACGEDIVWIPGYRVARHYVVADPGVPHLQITVTGPDSR